jgi:hypothetical protein
MMALCYREFPDLRQLGAASANSPAPPATVASIGVQGASDFCGRTVVKPYRDRCLVPHADISFRIGFRLSPWRVSEYSTRGGTSAYTFPVNDSVALQFSQVLGQHLLG